MIIGIVLTVLRSTKSGDICSSLYGIGYRTFVNPNLSMSALRCLAGLPRRLFLSYYGLQVVIYTMRFTMYLFICVHFNYICYLFSKASGVYIVGDYCKPVGPKGCNMMHTSRIGLYSHTGYVTTKPSTLHSLQTEGCNTVGILAHYNLCYNE